MAERLVQFKADIFPHVTGEIKAVDSAELKRVDQVAKERKLKVAYEDVKAKKGE